MLLLRKAASHGDKLDWGFVRNAIMLHTAVRLVDTNATRDYIPHYLCSDQIGPGEVRPFPEIRRASLDITTVAKCFFNL